MNTILVTGSNGLLGQKLTDQLRNNNEIHLVNTSLGVDRYPNPSGYEYYPLDITDENAVYTLIDKIKPQTIIHTAAMTNVDTCESKQSECWDLNVNAVNHLIKASEKHGIHLIHLSTDFIYDGAKGPYKETDEANPLSFYGKSKLAAEEQLKNSNIDYTIVRTIIVYGVAAAMSRTNIVLWAKGALEKAETISVVNDQFRMPTLAEDLATACIIIANKKALGEFNISGKDFMSVLEIVERVADYYQLSKEHIKVINSESLNQAAKRPPRTGFILDKAINELNYQPHSFEEGLAIISKQLKDKAV